MPGIFEVKEEIRMVGQGQGEPSGKGESRAESRCQVPMYDDQPCGRSLHHALPGVDEEPACLMHSRNSEKNDAEFQAEFERILREAGDGLADFSRFIFPGSSYSRRKFAAKCIFDRATFTQHAQFELATFTQGALFYQATFTEWAQFISATFAQDADFFETTFAVAQFMSATFMQSANFGGAQFTQGGNFNHATFTQNVNFSAATFMQDATFMEATFTRDADFRDSTLAGTADFRRALFAGAARFEEIEFRQDGKGRDYEIGPVFSGAVFEEPEKVAFNGTHLDLALFHNCDISQMNFSDVTWRKRANGKSMVFEEAVDPQNTWAKTVRPPEDDPNPRNYRLIAELYQQLKKNYDDRRDYWTAGDFHYGEMEMKRLASDHHNKILRWMHSNLGLVAWYKYASEYGESYVRPAWWLGLVLLVFMFLYPVAGLHLDARQGIAPATASASAEKLTYLRPLQSAGDTRSVWRARRDLVGHSFATTLYVAALQKDLTYQPSYPWGRLLVLAEVLLTSTLGALFLLAVRRQFKR